MRKIEFIVIHCTGASPTQSLASIQAYWRKLGWKRPGYHRLIPPSGKTHVLAEYETITNGVAGRNQNAIHISYTGGVNQRGEVFDTRTQFQRDEMQRLVEEAHLLFPSATICGHRDFSPDKNRNGIIEPNEWTKACPSFSVKAWLDEIGFKSSVRPVIKRTITRVNIRTGAGPSFPLASSPLEANVMVRQIGESNGWSYVQVEPTKLKGWIRSDFLQSI